MTHLRLALDYVRKGYYVHPLCWPTPNGHCACGRNHTANEIGKAPLAPHGSDDATRDEATIQAWWRQWPNANIGFNLEKSGLLDIAPDCTEWAHSFMANGMPKTALYTSGSAWHALYRRPADCPIYRSCKPQQYDILTSGNAVAPGSVHRTGRVYTLKTDLPHVENLPEAPAWAVAMLCLQYRPATTKETISWVELPSGVWLAKSARFRALVNANTQLQAVCGGETVSVAGDSSTSAQRAVFVNQLIRAHYPHDEIRALAEHFAGVLDSGRGWHIFQADIERLLIKYTPTSYSPEATRGTSQTVQPPRGGRHYELTAGELLDLYHVYADCGRRGLALDWTVSEVAERLGVSTGTIKRREAELVATGSIRRVYGAVILSPATWDIGSQRLTTPQTTEDAASETIGSQRTEMRQGAIDMLNYAIRSQFDSARQDALNEPAEAVCIERACDHEITHPPLVTPDRGLLSCVRALARQAGEPAWHQRDYEEWSDDDLLTEIARLDTLVVPAPDAPGASYVDILDWTQPGGVCAVPRDPAEHEKPDWLRAAGSLGGKWEPHETEAEIADQQVLSLDLLGRGEAGRCVHSQALEMQSGLFTVEVTDDESPDEGSPTLSDHPGALGSKSLDVARPLGGGTAALWAGGSARPGRAGPPSDRGFATRRAQSAQQQAMITQYDQAQRRHERVTERAVPLVQPFDLASAAENPWCDCVLVQSPHLGHHRPGTGPTPSSSAVCTNFCFPYV